MRQRMTRAVAGAALAACCALAAAQDKSRDAGVRSEGLPGYTDSPAGADPAPAAPDAAAPSPQGDAMNDTTEREPSASTATPSGTGEPAAADEGSERAVTDAELRRVREAVISDIPTGSTQDLRVFNRDGKAYVTGTVDSESERDEVERKVRDIVGENAVFDLEIKREGEGNSEGATQP